MKYNNQYELITVLLISFNHSFIHVIDNEYDNDNEYYFI